MIPVMDIYTCVVCKKKRATPVDKGKPEGWTKFTGWGYTCAGCKIEALKFKAEHPVLSIDECLKLTAVGEK